MSRGEDAAEELQWRNEVSIALLGHSYVQRLFLAVWMDRIARRANGIAPMGRVSVAHSSATEIQTVRTTARMRRIALVLGVSSLAKMVHVSVYIYI